MKRWRKLTFTVAALALFAGGAALTHRLTDDSFVPPPPITDELPAGAVARIGDGRFRPRWGNVGFTADGKGLVAGAPDGVVRVFDVVTGREVRRFDVHTEPAGSAAAAPATMTTALDRLMFWRRPAEPPQPADGVHGLAVSPDGRLVATLGYEVFRVTDLATGERIADWPCDWETCDWEGGATILWTSDSRAGVLARETIQPWSLDPPVAPHALTPALRGSGEEGYAGLTAADLVPVTVRNADGTLGPRRTDVFDVAAGSTRDVGLWLGVAGRLVPLGKCGGFATVRADRTVEIFDRAFRTRGQFGLSGPRTLLGASLDGSHLLLAEPKAAYVGDLSGEIVRQFAVTNARQTAFSPDGKLAAIVGDCLLVVDTTHWSPVGELKPSALDACDFGLCDDDAIVARHGARIVVTDARAGRTLADRARMTDPSREISIEARGRVVATCGVYLDPRTGHMLGPCRDSPDILGWRDGKPLMRRNFSDSVLWAYSADGSRAAWRGDDCLMLRSTDGGQEPWVIAHGEFTNSMALSADGSVLAAACTNGMRVYRTSDATEISRFPSASLGRRIALSFDGTRLACLAADPTTIELHDATTGALLTTFEGHAADVTQMHFSADGRLLVTGSPFDGTILVWDVEAALR